MLPSSLNSTLKTPVFPVKVDYRSSSRYESTKAVPRLKVSNCDKSVTKTDTKLKIDDKEFDISLLTVLDVYKLLKDNGIDIKFLDNKKGWDLPSACICNFTNNPTYQHKMQYIPFNTELLNTIKSDSIVPLEQTDIKITSILINKKLVPINIIDGLIHDIDGFVDEAVVIYKVFSKNFYIKLNNEMFSSSNKELICKHIGRK